MYLEAGVFMTDSATQSAKKLPWEKNGTFFELMTRPAKKKSYVLDCLPTHNGISS